MKVEGKHIVIAGAARSGAAAALLLKEKKAAVFVSDSGPIAAFQKEKLQQAGIPFEENGHTEKALQADFVVTSPGVPDSSPIIQHYKNQHKKVYSELEAAFWFAENPVIAVTGSNGKTTVCSWLADVWEKAGRNYSLAGNIGFAFSDKIHSQKGEFILEVSSFQLDHISTFKPAVSLLLNITPDHLNRYHDSLDEYAASKFRITENQRAGDYFIYNYDDALVRGHAESLQKKTDAPALWAFSSRTEVENGAFVRGGHIVFKFNHTEEILMSIEELSLNGRHNLYNGMATALAARAAEIKNKAIRESLKSFVGIEHRLEVVRITDGVKYINDSKATNVNAVWFALDSFSEPMTLILGGRDKGNDYSELVEQIREKVHTIIAIGESKEKIQKELADAAPNIIPADTMHEAVQAARKAAKRGEIVLLSPACSSFDMFESYEHRGRVFKEEVHQL